MQLQQSIKNVFVQLSESIDGLTDEQYAQPISALSNATIGQHVRHIVELFICLENGCITGVVNYEKRKRDKRYETDKDLVKELLHLIYKKLDKVNKDLLLETSGDENSDEAMTIITNYYREIVYNLEHTVHHMALIRVGLNEISNVHLPEGYGVASSTMKYRKSVEN
ncbi:MAG TPA: hypothetical protein VKT28_19715 [Puia sp.]|nr:hypothetical protein [Puia sp.]